MTGAPSPTPLAARQIEAIERATLAAVAPRTVETMQDDAGSAWLLPVDPGTVGRAHSAVPLSHDCGPRDPLALIEQVEARYADHNQPPRWRLADVPAFGALREALLSRGYFGNKPTLTQTADLHRMLDTFDAPGDDGKSDSKSGGDAVVEFASVPDADWARVFLGPGFDPVDGASRVQSLSRGSGNLFASVRLAGRTVAVGTLSLAPEWAGVHGLRTEQAARGRGLAGRILHAMAHEASQRGVSCVFLQVEEGNTTASAIYRRAGFRDTWHYRYWSRPA